MLLNFSRFRARQIFQPGRLCSDWIMPCCAGKRVSSARVRGICASARATVRRPKVLGAGMLATLTFQNIWLALPTRQTFNEYFIPPSATPTVYFCLAATTCPMHLVYVHTDSGSQQKILVMIFFLSAPVQCMISIRIVKQKKHRI